jgi:hypothetical protein
MPNLWQMFFKVIYGSGSPNKLDLWTFSAKQNWQYMAKYTPPACAKKRNDVRKRNGGINSHLPWWDTKISKIVSFEEIEIILYLFLCNYHWEYFYVDIFHIQLSKIACQLSFVNRVYQNCMNISIILIITNL